MKYLHGSHKLFGKGFMLTAQRDGYAQQGENKAFEDYMDSRRPQDKTSRLRSVFLSTDAALIDGAGGYIDAVYEVKPQSTPEASDLAWYTEAHGEFDSKMYGGNFNQEKMDRAVDAYWQGTPHPIAERSNIEYRVRSATVVRMIELNVSHVDELVRVASQALTPQP